MLENLRQPRDESICKMMADATTLSKEDLKIFLDAVNNPNWGATPLAAELTKLGFYVGRDSLLKHRKGECRCAK